jgi:hypothetical protein
MGAGLESQKTKDQLEKDMRSRETLALVWGVLVVVGLAIETVASAILDDTTKCSFFAFPCHKFWPVLADILVTLGVFGEIWWSRKAGNALEELRKRANSEVSLAQQETQLMRSHLAWRELSRGQIESIKKVLKGAESSSIEFHYFSADPESNVFARRIGDVFERAGWQVGYVGSSFAGKTLFGLRMLAYADAATTIAVKVARDALHAADLELSEGEIPRGAFNDVSEKSSVAGQVLVYVGPKPRASA